MGLTKMSPRTPIRLEGANLGERHRELNALVSEAFNVGEPIEKVLELPEKSAIDRLFKIDLASKQKHVPYILKNLKEADMLYVSRALKAKWLLEESYKEIMNPAKLEVDVYPEMILPAVNKMKHWIYLNLQDETRCQEFYYYYRDNNNPKLAMKYMLKCSSDLIIKEILRFFKNDSTVFCSSPQYYVTPRYFKMFCERSPLVAKLVYDLLDEDTCFRSTYNRLQFQYFESLQFVLKSDPDIFLDIIEKHFNVNLFSSLSSSATRFIMTQKKERFLRKPELYAAWLLDMKELAKCLSSTECEELVILLARSKFLDTWFEYSSVELLIKRIDKNKRAEFKKRLFILGEVGEEVKEWPYPPPGPPAVDDSSDCYDNDHDELDNDDCLQRLGACLAGLSLVTANRNFGTHLDQLFNEYRFKSFSESLFDMSKKILAESDPRNRMHMMLVLISKSGGQEEHLEAFFKFLIKHCNEPPQMRAAVIRSLVKRCAIWRASDGIWDNLLKFGEGLCLGGSTSETECKEGLHAVVIRNLMQTGKLTTEIKSSYLNTFSTFDEYKLSKAEKYHIYHILPKLLLESANTEKNGETAADILLNLLDTLKLTKVPTNHYNDVILTVKKLLERDEASGKRVLNVLFNSKIGRKDLFKENFLMIQQRDDSYINALKHDIEVLTVDRLLKAIVVDNIDLDRYLRKVCVYFADDGGLASRLLKAMKKEKTHINLARPIAFLIGANLKTYISKMDVKREVCKDDKNLEKFCAEIRANAHLARPEFDIDAITWRQAGVKLVANKVLICRSVDINKYIEQSLLWKRSVKLATLLAKRSDRGVEVLKIAATMRPTVAIKAALDYLKHDQATPRIWKTIKPLILKLEPGNRNVHLMQKLENLHQIPESIRPEFIQILYPLYFNSNNSKLKNGKYTDTLNLYRILKHVHRLLPKMEPQFIENMLLKFLQNDLTALKTVKPRHPLFELGKFSDIDMHIRILAKFLLICKNENEQDERFARLGDLFFDILETYNQQSKLTYHYFLAKLLHALKSNSVFFSNEFVSCEYVMLKVLKRMHSQLPMEEYFKVYVEVHLSMVYYLAVRHIVTKVPHLFVGEAENQKMNKEGMQLIFRAFGKYIASEAKELMSTYFESVVELYSKGLKDYLLRFRESRHELSLPLVKGIIEGSDGFEGRLAIDLYIEYYKKNEDWDEIRNLMVEKFDKNMMFFFYNSIEINSIM